MFDLGAQFGLSIASHQYFWSGIRNYVEVRTHEATTCFSCVAGSFKASKGAQPNAQLNKEGANQFARIIKTARSRLGNIAKKSGSRRIFCVQQLMPCNRQGGVVAMV